MSASELNKLLIILDNLDGLEAALGKAARLANAHTSTDVVQVVYDSIAEEKLAGFDPGTNDKLIELLINEAGSKLAKQVAAAASKPQGTISTHIRWDKERLEAMLAQIQSSAPALVIKPLATHRQLAPLLQAPLDWNLMRKAPVPVLFCSSRPWADSCPVLAALDLGDEAHGSLNRAILQQAHSLASTLNAPLHLVSVYPMLGQELIQYQTAPDIRPLKSAMESQRREACASLLAETGLSATAVHVVQGRRRLAIR